MKLLTFSGVLFDCEHPQPYMVNVDDVAHALSGLNRFGAHARYPFPYALHCLAVADHLSTRGESEETQLAGLLHDAHKAYLGDISPHVRASLKCGALEALEARIQGVVAEAFGVTLEALRSPAVRQANLVARTVEAESLLPDETAYEKRATHVCDCMKSQMTRPVRLPAEAAKEMFLRRYHDLTHSIEWNRAWRALEDAGAD